METNGIEIKNFKKVVIIYNPNSGKQIFVSMLSRVLDLKRRLTAIIGPNRVELTELREFKKLSAWADKIKEEKYDWVIVAGGDGTLRAMIAELNRNGYMPYISETLLPRSLTCLPTRSAGCSVCAGAGLNRCASARLTGIRF